MTTLPPFPTLSTTRLRLREISISDAEDLFAIHGDPDLMRYFGSSPLADISAARDLVGTFAKWRSEPNPGVRWAIQPLHQPSLVGTCGLFKWHREWRKCTLGYELASSAQGRGYMTESLTAAISWGFQNMDLNRIEALIHPDNASSIRLVKHLGFVEEGRLREGAYWADQFHDMLQFSLLRSEWRPRVGT